MHDPRCSVRTNFYIPTCFETDLEKAVVLRLDLILQVLTVSGDKKGYSYGLFTEMQLHQNISFLHTQRSARNVAVNDIKCSIDDESAYKMLLSTI